MSNPRKYFAQFSGIYYTFATMYCEVPDMVEASVADAKWPVVQVIESSRFRATPDKSVSNTIRMK